MKKYTLIALSTGLLAIIFSLVYSKTTGTTGCCDQIYGKEFGFPLVYFEHTEGGFTGTTQNDFFFWNLILNILIWVAVSTIIYFVIKKKLE